MTKINIKIVGVNATAEKSYTLTSGMVGVPVSFTFDSGWDGLAVTAVFRGGGVTVIVPLLGTTETVVPWEVMKRSNTRLYVGVEGRLPDGTIVMPTTWANVGTITSGANATDDLASPPTPTAFDRIMSAIGNLDALETGEKESLVAAINSVVAGIPQELPNPNPVIFSGDTVQSYDGSTPVTVELPSALLLEQLDQYVSQQPEIRTVTELPEDAAEHPNTMYLVLEDGDTP